MTGTRRWTRTQLVGLALGPALLALTLLLPRPEGLTPEGQRLVAVTALIACWWITEALPIPVTSLLPLVLFPALGILGGKEVATQYASDAIFLFLGGFLIAIAIERSGLHRTIALAILRRTGTSPALSVLGFMAASALLSMWISNTATALMLLPIALAVVRAIGPALASDRDRHNLSVGVLLGVAYGASIGGIATPVGTPPNVVMLGLMGKLYPAAPPLSFSRWMLTFLPLSLACLPLAWALLTQVLFKARRAEGGGWQTPELPLDGPRVARDELLVGLVFLETALLWIFRSDLALGAWTLPGWSRLLGAAGGQVTDGTVAIFTATQLFLLPSRRPGARALMSWHDAGKVPWGVLLLFGGGFALAHGFKVTEVSAWLGGLLHQLHGLPPWLLVLVVAVGVTHLTELTSNTATTTILVPIAAAAAVPMGVHPLLLMLPVTIAASFAFMLPVATPPNAIVFGSGHLRMGDMVRAGLVLNLTTALLLLAVVSWLAPRTLGFSPLELPAWAVGP